MKDARIIFLASLVLLNNALLSMSPAYACTPTNCEQGTERICRPFEFCEDISFPQRWAYCDAAAQQGCCAHVNVPCTNHTDWCPDGAGLRCSYLDECQ